MIDFYMPPLCQLLCLLCGKVRRLFHLMCSELNLTVIRSYTCANEKHNGCNNCHALCLVAAAVRDTFSPCLVIIPLHSFCKKKEELYFFREGVVVGASVTQNKKERKNKKTPCFIAICFHCVFFLLFFCFCSISRKQCHL